MAKQKFSAVEREAIWMAYEKKCAYTRELLDVSSFHIDHILPESLASKPDEFSEVKLQLGLSDDFDLFGFENLVPCKARVNLQKTSLILRKSSIHYFLGIAYTKKLVIKDNINKIKNRVDKGKAVVLLQQLIEGGHLSVNDLADILDRYDKNPDEIFKLLSQMEFADNSEIDIIRKTEIEHLMDRPVKFGPNDHVTSIPMAHESFNSIEVSTCREYLKALKSGYYVAGGIFIKIASWLEHYSMLLISLKTASMPELTFVSNPKSGISDLQLLPATMFPFMESSDFDLSGKTYQDLVTQGLFYVRRVSQNLVQIETDTMGQQLVEVVRADFNKDGVEDILIYEYCYAVGGSLGYGDVQIVTRKAPDALFEVITAEVCTREHIAKSL